MKLDWMMLANHAEALGGLAYISGGSWDTMNVHTPSPPGGPVAFIQGTFAARLLFHRTEAGSQHIFAVQVADEDGSIVGKVDGSFSVPHVDKLPAGFDIGFPIAISLTGLPLSKFGSYSLSLLVDGQHQKDIIFRVVKQF